MKYPIFILLLWVSGVVSATLLLRFIGKGYP